MTMDDMVSRWEQMRNDIERQLEILRIRPVATDGKPRTAQTIDDLNSLREKLEALLIQHGSGRNAEGS